MQFTPVLPAQPAPLQSTPVMPAQPTSPALHSQQAHFIPTTQPVPAPPAPHSPWVDPLITRAVPVPGQERKAPVKPTQYTSKLEIPPSWTGIHIVYSSNC